LPSRRILAPFLRSIRPFRRRITASGKVINISIAKMDYVAGRLSMKYHYFRACKDI
jgi:hypothetical protein